MNCAGWNTGEAVGRVFPSGNNPSPGGYGFRLKAVVTVVTGSAGGGTTRVRVRCHPVPWAGSGQALSHGNSIMVMVIPIPLAWIKPSGRTPMKLSFIPQSGFRTRNRAEGWDFRPLGRPANPPEADAWGGWPLRAMYVLVGGSGTVRARCAVGMPKENARERHFCRLRPSAIKVPLPRWGARPAFPPAFPGCSVQGFRRRPFPSRCRTP